MAFIKERAPSASYFHCFSHALNLCAVSAVSSNVLGFAHDVVKETTKFFKSSAKRTDLLKSCIQEARDTRISKSQLISLCTTRFIERHTSVTAMRELLLFVVDALNKMLSWESLDARRSAQTLLKSVCSSDFVVGLLVLEEVCSLMLPLTRKL